MIKILLIILLALTTLTNCANTPKKRFFGKIYSTKESGEHYKLKYALSYRNKAITKIQNLKIKKSILIGYVDGLIIESNLEGSIKKYTGHKYAIIDIMVLSNKRFITSDSGKKLILWKHGKEKAIKTLQLPSKGYITSLSQGKNKTFIASSKSGEIYVIDENLKNYKKIIQLNSKIWSVVFYKKINLLAIGDNNGQIYLYKYDSKLKQIKIFKKHKYAIESLCFITNNQKKYLISASRDKKLIVWKIDKETLSYYKTLRGHSDSILTIDRSLDKKFIFSAGWDSSIYIWNTKNFQIYDIIYGHKKAIQSILFLHKKNNKYFLISSSLDSFIKLWEIN